ncbi:MAG UNVERIFIED_CONTAM: hypothetical protein LOD86_07595 [Thermobifida fusca]
MLTKELEATKQSLEDKAVARGHNMGAWVRDGCDYKSVCSDCGREIIVCESVGVLAEIAAAPCAPGEEEKEEPNVEAPQLYTPAPSSDDEAEDGDIDEEDRDEDEEEEDEEEEHEYEVLLRRWVMKRHEEYAYVTVSARDKEEAELKAIELYDSGCLDVYWDEAYSPEEIEEEEVWVDAVEECY